MIGRLKHMKGCIPLRMRTLGLDKLLFLDFNLFLFLMMK